MDLSSSILASSSFSQSSSHSLSLSVSSLTNKFICFESTISLPPTDEADATAVIQIQTHCELASTTTPSSSQILLLDMDLEPDVEAVRSTSSSLSRKEKELAKKGIAPRTVLQQPSHLEIRGENEEEKGPQAPLNDDSANAALLFPFNPTSGSLSLSKPSSSNPNPPPTPTGQSSAHRTKPTPDSPLNPKLAHKPTSMETKDGEEDGGVMVITSTSTTTFVELEMR